MSIKSKASPRVYRYVLVRRGDDRDVPVLQIKLRWWQVLFRWKLWEEHKYVDNDIRNAMKQFITAFKKCEETYSKVQSLTSYSQSIRKEIIDRCAHTGISGTFTGPFIPAEGEIPSPEAEYNKLLKQYESGVSADSKRHQRSKRVSRTAYVDQGSPTLPDYHFESGDTANPHEWKQQSNRSGGNKKQGNSGQNQSNDNKQSNN